MKATLKAHLIKSTLIVAVLLSLPILAHGANVSLTTSDTINTSSFNAAGKWGNAQAPSAANDYYTSTFFMRTPGDGGNITYTFAGNSLTLQAPAGQGSPMRSILVKSGNNDTFIINNLTNAGGGVINNGGSGNVTVTFTGNQWTMAGNATIISDQGSTIIGYPIVGSFNLTNSGSTQSGVHQTTFTGSLSGFTGRMILLNLGGGMVVNLNSGTSNLGNPAIFTPDQWSIGVGCAITDNAGLTFNNPNAGFTLTGNGTINAAATTVIAEPITGGFTFTKGGAGTLTLSAANTYSGATVISAGTLQIGVANALTNTGSVTDNSVLDLNTFSITIDALSGSGSVDTLAGGTPTLTVGANNGSGTLSGLIQNSSGTMSLTKIGSGTETLSGGYSYSGATTVAGGTLSLNSALSLPASPGNLVISNGAVLTANVSSGIPLPANNLVVGTNSTLALTLNSAANGINVAGNLTLQDNATNNFNYGSLTANPTGTNINVAGGISAPGSSIVINITALGLKPGTITLIKYTGPALGSIANFSLSAPPGVVATLVNNTGNDSIDLNITSTPNQLAWNGVNGTGWDLAIANWTNIITGGITVFRQYTNGSIIAGDSVLFDDSVTNDLVNPQPTNIVLTSTFYAFPLVVNSTLPYSISGAGGITGVTSLVKSNTGSLTLLTSNSFAGGVFINDSGSLIITNDSALGASSGAVTLNGGTLQINGGVTNSRAIPMPVTSTIGVGAGATARLGGVISGVSSLNKTDLGTLVLARAETCTGDLFPHAQGFGRRLENVV